VRLGGALFGGTGGGCENDGGLCATKVLTTASGADADGLCREKIEKGFDLFDVDAVDVDAAVTVPAGFVGDRRAGRRASASCSRP
jgi:hypothetical protein